MSGDKFARANEVDPPMIDIRGVDKVVLLFELWSRAKQHSDRDLAQRARFDVSGAAEAVKSRIDNFCGRTIDIDISGDSVDTRKYDAATEIPGNFVLALNQVRKWCARRGHIDYKTFARDLEIDRIRRGIFKRKSTTLYCYCPDKSGRTFVPANCLVSVEDKNSIICSRCTRMLRDHFVR